MSSTQAVAVEYWKRHPVEEFTGEALGSYLSYASDERFRRNAASGGTVTALLSFLLNSAEVDGALVCRSSVENGNYRTRFEIAEDESALLQAQGSIYSAVYFARDALPLIRAYRGRLAVVALPCDISLLRRVAHQSGLSEKLGLVIGLFCGHNSEPALTERSINSLCHRAGRDRSDLVSFRHRRGSWRGKLAATFRDGYEIERPFQDFSDYQNLYFYCQQKCHCCADHLASGADIVAGDIWSLAMKREPIKHNSLLIRTPRGEDIFQRAVAAEVLTVQPVPRQTILDGQSRTLPFHHNIEARSRFAKLFGLKIPNHRGTQAVRWNHALVAFLVLANERISRTSWGQKALHLTPRPVLKGYLYLLKGLESL